MINIHISHHQRQLRRTQDRGRQHRARDQGYAGEAQADHLVEFIVVVAAAAAATSSAAASERRRHRPTTT